MSDKIFIAEVPAHEHDSDPYRFFFLSVTERDRFVTALRGHVDSNGDSLVGTGFDNLSTSAESAIAEIKHYLGWRELPNAD